METFEGRAHVPGAETEWIVIMNLDWNNKAAEIHVEGQPSHLSSWIGLDVQTFGDYELAFKTKGIPPLLTHWWHFVKPDQNTLWGIILGLPGNTGDWTYCGIKMQKKTT